MLRLQLSTVDYAILAIYVCVVLGIGFIARLFIKTDIDFFPSGRSLPASITGLAFMSSRRLTATNRSFRPLATQTASISGG